MASTDRSLVEGIRSGESFDAKLCGNAVCVETGDSELADLNRSEELKFLAPEAWYNSPRETDPSPARIPQTTQIGASKLPRKVRQRRARFLQSCSEPEVDKKRLDKKAPR